MSEGIKVHVVDCNDRKFLYTRYVDPTTGRSVRLSTQTTNRREAEKRAAKWEAELQEGRYTPSSKILWADFRERYEEEKLPGLAEQTGKRARGAFGRLQRVIVPGRLTNLVAAALSIGRKTTSRFVMSFPPHPGPLPRAERETILRAILSRFQAVLREAGIREAST